MSSRRVILLPECTYSHRNGYTYRCLGREEGGYVMQSPAGWTCTAFGIWQQDDGKIWWDYSTKGYFAKMPSGKEVPHGSA